MTINLDELESVARAATPGPRYPTTTAAAMGMNEGERAMVFDAYEPRDRAFFAAFDPPTVLALIAELRRVRECIEEVRAWWMSDHAPTVSYKQYRDVLDILTTYDQEGAS